MIRVEINHVTAKVTYELKTDDVAEADRFLRVAMRDHHVLLDKAEAKGTYGFIITKGARQ